MTNGNGLPPLPPTLPPLWSEEDQKRLVELESLQKEQQRIYGVTYTPEAWASKSLWEKASREFAASATKISFPPGPSKIADWLARSQKGLSPEQADVFIRETEEELQEFRRRKTVAEELPQIRNYITIAAMQGLPIDEEAYLYTMLPRIDPVSGDALQLSERERKELLNYVKSVAGKSKEEIAKIYSEGTLAPRNLEELMEQFKAIDAFSLDPRYIMSTVAFSKDLEQIQQTLQVAYPPQVEDEQKAFEDTLQGDIVEELRSYGELPSGDWEKDIKRLEELRGKRATEEGVSSGIVLPDGTVISVEKMEDGYYSDGVKVANIGPDDNPVALSPAEEYELGAGEVNLREFLPEATAERLSDAAVAEFWDTGGDAISIFNWMQKWLAPSEQKSIRVVDLGKIYLKKVIAMYVPGEEYKKQPWYTPEGIVERIPFVGEAKMSFMAGAGDVLTVAGGATRWMGQDGIADLLSRGGEKLQVQSQDDLGEFNWKHIANPRFYSLRVARTIPFTLALLPLALVGWKVGAAAGVAISTRFALGTFGRTILTTVLGGTGGALLSRPLESFFEAGAAYDRVKDAGGSDEEADAAADNVFKHNLLLAGVDMVQIATIFAPSPIKVPSGLITKGLVRTAMVGGRITIVGLTEGGEEVYQEAITRTALGEDPYKFDAEMQQCFALGGMMGVGMSGGGLLLTGIINDTKTHMTPAQKAELDKTVGEVTENLVSKGVAKQEAQAAGEAQALDDFAETPEGAKLVEQVVEVAKEKEVNKQVQDPAKRVHNKEVAFLEGQLINLYKELGVFRSSYNTHVANMEKDVLPADKLERQEIMKGLETNIKELQAQREDIESKLAKIAPGEVIPVAPEAVELATEEVATNALIAKLKSKSALKSARTAKAAGLAMDDLSRLREGGVEVADAEAALDEFISMERDDFDTAEEFREGRNESWNEYVEELGNLEEITITPAPAPVEPIITQEKVDSLSTEELSEGKAIDTKAAIVQAAALPEGTPERAIPDEWQETTREAARGLLESQLYGADLTNPISRAMVGAYHLGDIGIYTELLNQLPKTEGGNIDWDAHITAGFGDAEFSDVSSWNLGSMPALDAVTLIDKGVFGRPLRMKVYQVVDQAMMASLNYQGAMSKRLIDMERNIGLERPSWIKFRRRTDFNEKTAALVELISQEDTTIPMEELLQKEGIAKIVAGLTEEQQTTLVEYARQMRILFDDVLAEVNQVRVTLGREPIEYRANYLPWVYQTNIWGKFLGIHLKPDSLAEQALAPEYMFKAKTAPTNVRALARKGGLAGYEKIRDVRRLFVDYVSVASREMFFTPAINNAKAASRFLINEKGLDAPGRYIENWALRGMVGVPDGLSRFWMETVPPFVRTPFQLIRSRLNPAVFGLNLMWNVFVQTSSIALSGLHIGSKWTAAGTQYLWNPKARRWVQNNVPAHVIKQRGIGSVVHQDLGATLSEAQKITMGPLETVDNWLTFFTRIIEREITGVTAYAGYLKGKSQGLTGAELVAYASDNAAKTQSMYDPIHLPLSYSPVVRLFIPFQTFCFEALTRVREMAGVSFLKAGAYESVAADSPQGKALIRTRMMRFLEFMAIIWVINLVGETLNKRAPWEPSSFLPAANIMMMGQDPSNPWNLPMPARWANELWRSQRALVEHGNWRPLTLWALRWHFPAGNQAARTVEGMIASIEGEHKDISGEVRVVKGVPFELQSNEWIKAVTLGVWRTQTGEEIRGLQREGLEVSTQRILKDLDKWEAQLGTSVEGKYYTLKDFGTEVLGRIREAGVPDWQILGDPVFYLPLTVYRVQCEVVWEEYNKLPADQRIQYRRDHPYIDATLVFWEKVQNPRTRDGLEELGRIFQIFGRDEEGNERPRMHWKGLPQVPDWVGNLPE